MSALNTLGHDVEHNVELEVRGGHADGHPKFTDCVAIAPDIGFSWGDMNKHYRLIAEEDTWDLNVPVQRFIDKLTQQYAIEKIKRQTAAEGYVVESETKNLNGSVELLVSRWG